MPKNQIVTGANPFQEFFTANQAPGAYPTLVNIATPIKNVAGVLCKDNGQEGPGSFGKITLWGSGTAGNTFNVQFVGYQLWLRSNGAEEWEPVVLADVQCT